MKANYYMGQTIGKKRSDGSPFYCVNILTVNRFNNLAVVPLYVTEKEYNDILEMDFEEGDPVIVSVSFAGVFNSISRDKRYQPLRFDELATATK